MAYFVSGVEFVGGSSLTVEFLSSLVCVGLLIDMIVAVLTNTQEVLYVLFARQELDGHHQNCFTIDMLESWGQLICPSQACKRARFRLPATISAPICRSLLVQNPAAQPPAVFANEPARCEVSPLALCGASTLPEIWAIGSPRVGRLLPPLLC
jgi:hypothetical protein